MVAWWHGGMVAWWHGGMGWEAAPLAFRLLRIHLARNRLVAALDRRGVLAYAASCCAWCLVLQ